jgi:ankyrin repeat protein
MMKLLLKAGASAGAPTNTGYNPLHAASNHGKQRAASLLLAHGADVNAATIPEGFTPLHYAAQNDHLEAMGVLLRAGASLTAVSTDGRTPLFQASMTGKEAAVRLLLASGADPYAQDSHGCLPLHFSSQENHLGVIRRLLHRRRVPAHVNATTAKGVTPLHVASLQGHVEAVALLVKAGADVDARSVDQRTPLHSAILRGHTSVVQALLAAGSDPIALTQSGASGLHVAAISGHPAILQQLAATPAVRSSGAVDAEYRGFTPLQWAVEKGHTSCVEALLAGGADANRLYGAAAVDGQGRSLVGVSILHRVVTLCRTAAVPLLATPANMARVYESYTPLHLALHSGPMGLEIAQALVAAGSPAGVPTAALPTAMAFVAISRVSGHGALLPAMVRGECERYKQLQQGVAGQQQQRDASAVLSAVVEALYLHIITSAAHTSLERPTQAVPCFKVVMEVLGPAAGGDLLQAVLSKVQAILAGWLAAALPAGAPAAAAAAIAAMNKTASLLLYKSLHTAWLEEVQPLLQQRQRLTHRLEKLVTQPLQSPPQQQQQQQQQLLLLPQASHKAPRSAAWASRQSVGLRAQAVAAARTGQWESFMQLLDQLTGLHKPSASLVLRQVEQQQKAVGEPGLMGLCGALLKAWQAAAVGKAGRMQQELAESVVGAVAAAGQLRLQLPAQEPQQAAVEGGVRKRRRTGRSGGRR